MSTISYAAGLDRAGIAIHNFIFATSRLANERISVLRIPGDRPAARSGGPEAAAIDLLARADHRNRLHQSLRVWRLPRRPAQVDATMVRPASVFRELGH